MISSRVRGSMRFAAMEPCDINSVAFSTIPTMGEARKYTTLILHGAYGGNVWVLWTTSRAVQVRALTHGDALRMLCASFEADGPDCGYNNVVSDYARLWWGAAECDPNLSRFPEHRQRLERTLKRHVGRVRSPRLAP